ncbi:MAG: tRNA pseudouridine(38-40) synthase TruA [Planctomycetaceae bacterium]|nr:tRNA pseudouridine(38-40) synthase TruA [Planctomycetaceae bacterium]
MKKTLIMSRRNIMLTLAYNGANYCGWQVQPDSLSIQECVERATEQLTGTRCSVLAASRTDSGVHAVGQVVNFLTDSSIPPQQYRRGLQRFLPDDITVVRSQQVHRGFHATYSAVRKRYRYLIYDSDVLPPFLRGFVLHSHRALSLEPMQSAIEHLRGTHDFRCFETKYPNKATSVRTVMEVSLERIVHWLPWQADHHWMPLNVRPHEAAESPLILFEITADGFLYNMVRAIIGTLIRIGLHQEPPEHVADVIQSQDRRTAGNTMPPEGLYLMQVDYPAELLVPEG